jgi:hypothetical protein
MNEYQVKITQLPRQTIYSMPIGTVFTYTQTGFEPKHNTYCIYRKHKRTKCIELIAEQEYSIPIRFFDLRPFGYPIQLDYSDLIRALTTLEANDASNPVRWKQ